ncbi:MAG TPA: pyridoxamine 5'-phosphate oxidase [Puia sp.]|jgi:pyridoxamine 5'-phosphate oxidase|nr:pyridoxamine 5'-phosphate oxidase [Puia sp.]
MKQQSSIRKEYKLEKLSEQEISQDPFQQFHKWWQDALQSEIEELNAMTLATASGDGVPSARIVLLKDFDEKGFVFYTNYESFKGMQLLENPRACLVFFWKELQRQVRITGLVEKTSAETSDEYFNSRPEGSRIGAIASPQSRVIEDRNWLEQKDENVRKELKGKPITRPAHWGGYRVKPVTIEFWQGRPNRLHDRIQYSLQQDASWKIERLAP